ncbi:FkbM family methyltransferase [Pararhizobium haloflavum]|uniref:FkbM family methyltransferase n=1 Tax=Pararhizobium haloflavum TaxID=2037914 RepID=UPI001FDEF6CE|nr:FkbM family methyltransferase [Pararhizobium haloflavum]
MSRSLVIYHGQPWRKWQLRRHYGRIIRRGDLCFDIGAHVGNRSAAMLAAGARVVACEPQPAFRSFLSRFVRSDRFQLVGKAVGREPGQMTLHISSRHPTVTTLSAQWIEAVGDSAGFGGVEWDTRAEVEVTTLDALIAAYGVPAFCKIDVEGMESEILAGLSQPIALVAFEYLPATIDMAHACIDRLNTLGAYEYNLVSGESHRFESEQWLSDIDLRSRLADCAASGRSGDIYARTLSLGPDGR